MTNDAMKPRLPYLLLLLLFAVSRLIYYMLGVRFDTRPLLTFFQIIDPELLRHRLLQSLYYLHMQPPGFNLYAGIILKLFPSQYAVAFHAAHLVFGAVICCLLYRLMRACDVHAAIAFALSALFIVSPGVVLFENFFLYEYMVVLLLLVAATALYYFFSRDRTMYAVVFLSCLFLLVLIRNQFHLVYLLLAFACLMYFGQLRRRAIFLAGIIPIVLTFSLFFKNWVLFGTFSSSTWLGMNMDGITSHQLTPEEATTLINDGVISRVSLIDAGAPISTYESFISPPQKTGIPVLDEEVTSTGATNFNNIVFFQIERYYIRDGLAILRHYPRAYLRTIEMAWFTYFLPTSDFPFFDLNRPKIWSIDRFFNVVFFGQWKDASDRKGLRAIEAGGNKLGLVLYTGTFLMIGLPLLWAGGIYYLISGVRRRTLDRATASLLGFLLFNITYLTAIANLLSAFENNRYRFQVDGFFLILLGIAVEQIRRRFMAWKVNAVAVDTTVQEKAIAHPTEHGLLLTAIEQLGAQAKKTGLRLRQSYVHVARRAAMKTGRYLHAQQKRRAKRQLKFLRVRLRRLLRDVRRKMAVATALSEGQAKRLEIALAKAWRIAQQCRGDAGYLYSWHATEVECISKGKARAPYEFGCKVSLATNLHPAKGGHFILHARALNGNPYDGHTLAAALEDIRKIVGRAPQRVAVDQGYKGHRIALRYTAVYITGQRRGVTEKIKRWLKRRAVVEPVIGHAKNDGLLGRNWLGERSGDRSNALLAAVGFNLRQLLRFLKRSKLFCAYFFRHCSPT